MKNHKDRRILIRVISNGNNIFISFININYSIKTGEVDNVEKELRFELFDFKRDPAAEDIIKSENEAKFEELQKVGLVDFTNINV